MKRLMGIAAFVVALGVGLVGLSSPACGPDDGADSSLGAGRPTSSTVILRIEGGPVYWPEFKFWLKQVTDYYKAGRGLEEITDWSVEQNGVALEEFLRSSAALQAAKGRAIEAQAAERGLELSEGVLAEIAQEREKNISIYGSESEYLRIVAGMYYSEDVYKYVQKLDYLTLYLFNDLYGQDGEKCTDEQVSAYVDEVGLKCATYIFLPDTGDDGAELSAEDKAANRALLQDLISRLDLSADPVALFVSLVDQYNEDRELLAYPDGRLFAPGTMGEEFENACAALDEGEHSGIVESPDGLYLILRLPIRPDMVADSSGNTLRFRTAYDYLFQNQLDEWAGRLEIEYEEVFDQIRVQGLFDS
ncbi:MAG: hypothetical protein LLG45_09190 [Actinomycetia bacterium]|nr:hypothetical protein [Actinomycetes bacterium]